MCIATCGRLLYVLGFAHLPKYTGALIFQDLFMVASISVPQTPPILSHEEIQEIEHGAQEHDAAANGN
jgi:hypothetical protein